MPIETSARYRILETVPEYAARAPLGATVINDFEDEINDVYTAILYLPRTDELGFGIRSGACREEKAVLQDLGKKVSEFYHDLCQKKELPVHQKLFKSYLDSMLSPDTSTPSKNDVTS